jgi:hypothetical protein
MAINIKSGKTKNPSAPHSQSSRKATRHREAEERNAAYAALTPSQKLGRIDQRLGFGKGAKRERARLARQRP